MKNTYCCSELSDGNSANELKNRSEITRQEGKCRGSGGSVNQGGWEREGFRMNSQFLALVTKNIAVPPTADKTWQKSREHRVSPIKAVLPVEHWVKLCNSQTNIRMEGSWQVSGMAR